MALRRCGQFGRPRVITGEPVIETCREALYVPRAGDWDPLGWGLYDCGDRLVISAARWMAAEDGAPAPAGGRWTAPAGAKRDAVPADPGVVHVYGGLLDAGTAEFLAGALSRFWSHVTRPGPRLLFHARRSIADLFEAPVVNATMRTLGITPDDCVVLDRPTRLACVIVPAASFESGRLAFPAYARLAATVATRLTGRTVAADLGRAPRHISSARQPTTAFRDEEAFDQVLERSGVAIIHPGEVSLATLLARVRSAGLVSSTARPGPVAVADQVAAFRDAGSRIMLCAGEPGQDALNIDALCGHRTLFLRPVEDITDVREMADAYLRAMRRLIKARSLPCELAARAETLDAGAEAACASSDGQDADVLVGGLLTGVAQLRIAGSSYPWWQAEFAEAREIDEVRVHGPITGEDRPSVLRLFGSFDGREWMVLAERDGTDPIGGIDGRPHRFEAGERPWRARILRLQSGTGVLALDQVEILAAERAA